MGASWVAGDKAIPLRHEWLDKLWSASKRISSRVVSSIEETLDVQTDLARALGRSIDEARAVLDTQDESPHFATSLAHWSDLMRSQTFLWAETNIKAQEHAARALRTLFPPLRTRLEEAPRALALITLAADMVTGYETLRMREQRWTASVGPADWALQHERGALRALDTAISLGGVLIKAGQFASVRPDLLPGAYIQRLSTLQDRVPPQRWAVIESAISRELGRQPRDIFTAINQEPTAAASLAQVHRARLADGRDVAVKVQYPGVADMVTADLAVLERIADLVSRMEPRVRLQPIVAHLRATLPLELDFAREAQAMTLLREKLAHRNDILIPAVVPEYSTGRLLVTDFVEGIKITDRPALLAAGIDPRAVARLLNDVYAEQLMRLGFVHADPHPGNLLVQHGPRLVLLDHGLTLQVPPHIVRALSAMVRALVNADFDALAAALAEAGLRLDQQTSVMALLQVVGVVLGGQRAQEAVDLGKQLSASIGDIPVELITVGRALGLLDGITRTLAPGLDTLEIVARYT